MRCGAIGTTENDTTGVAPCGPVHLAFRRMDTDRGGTRRSEPLIDLSADAVPIAPYRPRRFTGPAWRWWWRRRRPGRRGLLIAAAIPVFLVVSALAGGGYYVASVPDVVLPALPAPTMLYYRDGTELARLGEADRIPLRLDEMLPVVPQVAVAAADPGFWTNNIGAITRSVVRQATGRATLDTLDRARLVAQAWTLDDRYRKDEILAFYLNASAFGRTANGIEAAAQVYFDKSARRDAPVEEQITMAEAMVLLAMVDQPYADPDDPEGSPGFDPDHGQLAVENSMRRWQEIRAELVREGVLSPAQAEAMRYPRARQRISGPDPSDVPAALVNNHVVSELDRADWLLRGAAWSRLAQGGYSIVTTLDPKIQGLLEATLDESIDDSGMRRQPPNLQAAAVAVEPGTGRILGYYGGHDPLGLDYAGSYLNAEGEPVGAGFHPPGGTFHVHTLAAALRAGISLHSRWDTRQAQAGRPAGNPIRNLSGCPGGVAVCDLEEATQAGLLTTFYALTTSVTPAKVLATARDAGIDTMLTDARERKVLAGADPATLVPSQFDTVLGLGQYPVTVLDQANAMATYAAGGLRSTAHFVAEVRHGDEVLYREPEPDPARAPILTAGQLADLTWATRLSGSGDQLSGAPGSWEYVSSPDQNSDAWIVAFRPELAMAVWVGNKAESRPIRDAQGQHIDGSGLPKTMLNRIYAELQLPPRSLPVPVYGGREDPPLSVAG
jgi:membrane peptidoglycan carboxypeptidase